MNDRPPGDRPPVAPLSAVDLSEATAGAAPQGRYLPGLPDADGLCSALAVLYKARPRLAFTSTGVRPSSYPQADRLKIEAALGVSPAHTVVLAAADEHARRIGPSSWPADPWPDGYGHEQSVWSVFAPWLELDDQREWLRDPSARTWDGLTRSDDVRAPRPYVVAFCAAWLHLVGFSGVGGHPARVYASTLGLDVGEAEADEEVEAARSVEDAVRALVRGWWHPFAPALARRLPFAWAWMGPHDLRTLVSRGVETPDQHAAAS